MSPSLAGTAAIQSPAHAFVDAFARRVETGLYRGATPARCRYEVTETAPDKLRFRAMNFLTAISVGLNEVELAASPSGVVQYQVQYRRWAGYTLALSAGIGVILIAFFLLVDLRAYMLHQPRFPGLSVDQNIALAWSMAIFWGFAWPWILIAIYKRSLRREMEQLIADVDATATPR